MGCVSLDIYPGFLRRSRSKFLGAKDTSARQGCCCHFAPEGRLCFFGDCPEKVAPAGLCLKTMVCAGTHLAASSRQAETLERGASRSSTDVRHNDQFKNGDIREFNLIFLVLACCLRGTEIPLLAHNFSKRASAIRRPSQDELLGTLCLGFFEDERDACESLRLVED